MFFSSKNAIVMNNYGQKSVSFYWCSNDFLKRKLIQTWFESDILYTAST